MNILAITTPSQSQFNEKVSDILSRPEYAHLWKADNGLIEKMKEAIEKLLLNLFKKLNFDTSKALSISDRLSVIFLIMALILLVSIAIFIIVKIRKAIDKRSRIKEILGEKIDERTTPASLRSKAAEYGQEGDFRKAIRFDFIALLLLMHEQGVIYLDETKTNEEIYSYLKKNGFSKLIHFNGLIDVFNYSWYGHKQYDIKGYEVWESNLKLVWNEVIDSEKKNH